MYTVVGYCNPYRQTHCLPQMPSSACQKLLCRKENSPVLKIRLEIFPLFVCASLSHCLAHSLSLSLSLSHPLIFLPLSLSPNLIFPDGLIFTGDHQVTDKLFDDIHWQIVHSLKAVQVILLYIVCNDSDMLGVNTCRWFNIL